MVFNHMTADYQNAYGVGDRTANTYNKQYPGVPYGQGDFHPTCAINNYQDPVNVSDSELYIYIYIYINCNWVVTRWQYTQTIHRTTEITTEQHKYN